jgi:hypothetical protein
MRQKTTFGIKDVREQGAEENSRRVRSAIYVAEMGEMRNT